MGEGSEDRHSGVQTGKDIGQRHTHFHRPGTLITLRTAGQAHQPTQPLNHEVITRTLGIRPGLAETGNGAIDKLWVDRLQALVVQPISRQTTHLEVLDDNIGLRRQLTHQALPFRPREIDGHRTLVTVGRQVVSRLTGVFTPGILEEGRPPRAGIVTTARALHLYNVSAQVSENLARPWAGQHARKVQHPQM
ncbi:hypothetical protein D3C81_808520 [compost metagenome]